MNLKALHSFMRDKGFYYFEGMTSKKTSSLYITFSTLCKGKGDSIEFRIGGGEFDNDIICYMENKKNIKKINISDAGIFSFIKNNFDINELQKDNKIIKCIVPVCNNYTHEGKFMGSLCIPCYNLVHDIEIGKFKGNYNLNKDIVYYIIDNWKEILNLNKVKEKDNM